MELQRLIGTAAIDVDFVQRLIPNASATAGNFGFKLSAAEVSDVDRIFATSSSGNVVLFQAVGNFICPKKLCPGLLQPGSETALGMAILEPNFRQDFLVDPVNAAAKWGIKLSSFEQHTLASLMSTLGATGVATLKTLFEALGNAIRPAISQPLVMTVAA